MAALNGGLVRLFDTVFVPLAQLPPLVGIGMLALASAIAMLVVAHIATDQKALAVAKRESYATLFEIRLFSHDAVAVLRALGALLRQHLRYLRLSLPLMWMLVPLMAVLAHIQPYYGYTGF